MTDDLRDVRPITLAEVFAVAQSGETPDWVADDPHAALYREAALVVLETLGVSQPTENDLRAAALAALMWVKYFPDEEPFGPDAAPVALPPSVSEPMDVRVPRSLPQPTFEEFRETAQALGDGPFLTAWEALEGDVAWVHQRPRATLFTRLEHSPHLAWMGVPPTLAGLSAELERAGMPAVLLFAVIVETLLTRGLWVRVSLDDLITAIGWQPHSSAERERMRTQVWRWLTLVTSLEIRGQRRGVWRDDRGAPTDTSIRESLVVIGGREDALQLGFDKSAPPLSVTLAAGPWLSRFRGDPRVLSWFGRLERIAAIPAGRASGAWARAVGMALHQKWRERATLPTPDRWQTTRRDLFSLFTPEPSPKEVLAGGNPLRARVFWRAAIDALRQAGVIGLYEELAPLDTRRQGWADDWLDQPLRIWPAPDERQAQAAIAQVAERVRRRRGRPPKRS